MQPERIGVRDLVEPFRVGASRMNVNRQTKGLDQNLLIGCEVFWMDMTFDIGR
jgi:hypothetical protein